MWGDKELTAEQEAAKQKAIAKARETDEMSSIPTSDGNAYAYPQGDGSIAWGVNGAPDGFCIVRDVER